MAIDNGYCTIFHGAPYGRDGEYGDDVRTIKDAERLARRSLQPGQRMDLMDGSESTANLRARWECGQDGRVYRVNV